MRRFSYLLITCLTFSSFNECTTVNAPLNIEYSTIKPYPFVDGDVHDYDRVKKDENGIPLIIKNGKTYYHPVYIFRWALEGYYSYFTKCDSKGKEIFLTIAAWMKDSFELSGEDFGGWHFTEGAVSSYYKVPEKWLSAMSQGYSLSIMIEAYGLTGDPEYLRIADLVMNSFEYSIDVGGITTEWGSSTWYEEYASNPHSHVLNGFLFSLAGLYDYYINTMDKKADRLFQRGVKALLEHIEDFDGKFYSLYSQLGNKPIAKRNYHDIHIKQLLWLYSVTGEEKVYEYAHKFLQYDLSSYGEKFKNLEASYTMGDPDKYGVKNLIDGYWSWGGTWNSDRFPVSIFFTFDSPVQEFDRVVIVSSGHDLSVDDFNIKVTGLDSKKVVSKEKILQRTNVTGNSKAEVLVFALNEKLHDINQVELEFLTSNSIVRLREVNLTYNMEAELRTLQEKTTFWRIRNGSNPDSTPPCNN